ALEIQPHNYDGTYGIGVCYHYQQKSQQAMEYFRSAKRIDPSSALARLALGDALLQADQAVEAVAELKAAVALEPKMRQAYSLLGKAEQKLGRSREAEESFKKAQKLIQSEIELRESVMKSGGLDEDPIPVSPSR